MSDVCYLGFDPGAVTGMSWTALEGDELLHTTQQPLPACTYIYDVIDMFVTQGRRLIVSGEAYTMGSSVRSHQPDALYILGAVKWMIHKFFPGVELRITGAAEASHVGNIETLKAAGWWIKGDPDQHRNRASAQVAHAMMMTEPKRWYDLIKSNDESDMSDDTTNRAGIPGLMS